MAADAVPFTGFTRISREGQFTFLSADHRSTLRALMNPERPSAVSVRSLARFKCDIVRTISPLASAVMLDADSAPMCMKPGILSRSCGLVLSLEKSGFSEKGGERLTTISLAPASALKKRADCAKLQLHYNPRYLSSAERQLALAREVHQQCKAARLPLMLQIHTYEVPRDLHEAAMLEAASTFAPHCDLLCTEFPSERAMEAEAASACAQLVEAAEETPWLLSSYGDDFFTFRWKLEAACKGGAAGFVAGMALWKEAAGLQRSARDRFLNVIAAGRFMQLERTVRRHGRRL